jgi:hypothetical protein
MVTLDPSSVNHPLLRTGAGSLTLSVTPYLARYGREIDNLATLS